MTDRAKKHSPEILTREEVLELLSSKAAAGNFDRRYGFVERFNGDADGLAPWSNAFPGEIGGFRLTIADAPCGSGATPGTARQRGAARKCKKKKHRAASAKKHCKRKKH